MSPWLPVPLLLFTVGALIVVDERRPLGASRNVQWVGVWKPLSTLLVILVAVLSFAQAGSHDAPYSALIIGGLLLSLAGDVLLIFSAAWAFLAGLISFLCAHLVYTVAFIYLQTSRGLGSDWTAEWIAAAVLAAIALAIFSYLRPSLGKLRLPVIVYMLVISIMVHRALAVALAAPGPAIQPALIAGGALLFYFSDAILAIDRFKMGGSMRRGHLLNLSTYYAGQLLIALSAAYFTL